jgi:hypothetical protein
MKAETCCCYVLLINYFYVIKLCWTTNLYILLIKESIVDGREHYLPSPALSLSLSLNTHYQSAIMFSNCTLQMNSIL